MSAREKDEQRSTLWQLCLKHQIVLKIKRKEIVPVEIEILPSGTMFKRGSTLRLVVQGTELINDRVLRHDNSGNKGMHALHSGQGYDAYLLTPVSSE